jgi:hypothetical protein
MRESSECQPVRSKTYRVVTAGVGVLFIAIAAVIVVSTDLSGELGVLSAAVVIGALGFDALLGAVRNKQCLLSRIGPLP